MQKKALRTTLRAKREQIAKNIGDYSTLIKINVIPTVLSLLREDTKVVAGYYNINTEFNCTEILKELRFRYGFVVALPSVGHTRVLTFKEWDCNESSLVEGKFKIPSCALQAPDVRPDCIIVPMLAFNKDLYRLGYGGGFYDSTLLFYSNSLSIGLAFSEQFIEEMPFEESDVRLQNLVTEKGLYIP